MQHRVATLAGMAAMLPVGGLSGCRTMKNQFATANRQAGNFRKCPRQAVSSLASKDDVEWTSRTEGGVSYRSEFPLMALAFRDNHYGATRIDAGEVFEVIGPAQDDRFLLIDVRGEQRLVFECDLMDRSEPVPTRKARAAAK